MKKSVITFAILIVTMSISFAQYLETNSANIGLAKTTFKSVKTQSVSVNGTNFSYRLLGESNAGIPIIYLNHLAATMDDCDPSIMDSLAVERPVICFDNRGIGTTQGKTPATVSEMAKDAIAFIKALGYDKVDLLGFSLGGFISQEILLQEPQLINKAIIAGTGPAGGEGITNVKKVTIKSIFKGLFTFKDAKTYMFFNRDTNGKKAAKEFLTRLKERKENRDGKIKISSLKTQLKAIQTWGKQEPQDLSMIKQPILVVNGDKDIMVPTVNTLNLNKRISNSKMIVYQDAGHGGIFQYHDEFVKSALAFLQ